MEHQVVVVKNEKREIRLKAMVLKDGKADSIFQALRELLNEYDLWGSIKMIVTDTTSVNTGKTGGVVKRLLMHFESVGLEKPLYVGCQHHVLDRILRLCMDDLFGGNTNSPDLSYDFVEVIRSKYDYLRSQFDNTGVQLKENDLKWRDDMQFLMHLINVVKFFWNEKKFPMVIFKTLPNISQARWNSRAIFLLLAYILIPEDRPQLEMGVKFVTGKWADIWFSDHIFHPDNGKELQNAIKDYPKAINTFKNFWCETSSPINTQRSNICAERAVKVLQDIKGFCKSEETLYLKFLLTNHN